MQKEIADEKDRRDFFFFILHFNAVFGTTICSLSLDGKMRWLMSMLVDASA